MTDKRTALADKLENSIVWRDYIPGALLSLEDRNMIVAALRAPLPGRLDCGVTLSHPQTGDGGVAHDLCPGGVNPGWDECEKCGATSDDECRAIPLDREPGK